MPIESWTKPEDAPDLAAHATAMIDAALVGTALSRDAYWAAVRKGYNTPYNDPPPRSLAQPAAAPADGAARTAPDAMTLPVAALAAIAAEVRVA